MARLWTRAFADDPIERWCLSCDDVEAALEAEYLEAASQLATRGWLRVVDDLSGAAAWLPPGEDFDDDAIDAVVAPVLAAHGGDAARMDRFWEWSGGHRPAEPHWYLDLVASHPGRRGAGVGRLLLADGLARVDADGAACFLVTGNPTTVPWYARHGFVMSPGGDAPEGGPPVWFGLRPPAA